MNGVSQQQPQGQGAPSRDAHRWRLVLTEDELATLRDALAAFGNSGPRGDALRVAVDHALERIDEEDADA